MTLWLWRHRNQRILLTKIIFILFNQLMVIGIYGRLCEVETGQNNIILDIEESRGNSIDQPKNPPKLPIHGDVEDEITLGLIFADGNPIFKLNGKFLQLVHPLDRDKENLSHIAFHVSCAVQASGNASGKRSHRIPIIVRITDINDLAPAFVNTPYETTVAESTPVGSTVFSDIKALDNDAGVNGLVEYFIVEGFHNITDNIPSTLKVADGFGTFAISYPHQGQVTIVKTLDYERVQRYYLTIVASDRARNISERLSATTTLVVNVLDTDDQDPSFVYKDCLLFDGSCINPEYTATIVPGTVQKVLEILPEPIKAVDLDAISTPISYSFLSGNPSNYNEYFDIDVKSASVKQIKLVDSSVTDRQFAIIIKAEEDSDTKRFTTAKLVINVKPVDAHPPIIIATDLEGSVDENSPIGTKIMNSKGTPIKLTIRDDDYPTDIELPMYSFELTTPSFAVSKDGFLMVNEKGLDRESTEKLLFQIVAREIHGNAASQPLSIILKLNDLNDNPPNISKILPVSISAGISKRLIATAQATDADEGINSVVLYSIVNNKNSKKFSIKKENGEIYVTGRMSPNDKYNLTIRASDPGGLYSDTTFELTVVPSPNTKPPSFTKPTFDAEINEAVEINTTVITIQATDPEFESVQFTILSGNDLRQFAVDSESGIISVIRKLDRETLTKYQLVIQAEDAGGLSSTAVTNIKVTDFNDNSPEFDESTLPYLFSVDEGKINAQVGFVQAYDMDEGINSEIIYSVPPNVPFTIHAETGEIRTKEKLSFKKQNEYEFMVAATDRGITPLSSTIRIKISVKDVPDVAPVFGKTLMEVKVPENVPDYLVATVKASNHDIVSPITYTIKRNASRELFQINSKTGEIRTRNGLDYESKTTHEIVVGTVENNGKNPGDFVKIKVLVEDRNDVAPGFLITPEPISLTDDQLIGTLIASMPAVDTDGTSPGNVVRYEMIGKGKALKYFHIDPENGNIKIKDDLRKEPASQYDIDVRAYDLGEPQLSSVSSLMIFVKHIPKSHDDNSTPEIQVDSEEFGLAFGDEMYVTNIPESTSINATIKLIQVLNTRKVSKNKSGLSCQIVSGNDLGIFDVSLEESACAIKLRKYLDFENRTTHELTVKLSSNKHLVNPQRSQAVLKILVQDYNDNTPVFKFKEINKSFQRNDTYYGVVNYNATIGTNVLKVEAYDDDSGIFGLIKYRLIDDDSNSISKYDMASTFFTITDTGLLKTRRPFHKIQEGTFKFYVEARDNYGKDTGTVHSTKARVVINVISDVNRMTLVLSDSLPQEVQRHARALEEMLSEKSNGLVTTIEKFSNRRSLTQNGSIVDIPTATDVWFYAINPRTEKILERNSTEIFTRLLDPSIQSQINIAASRLIRATADGIFGPVEAENEIQHLEVSNSVEDNVLHYSLISVAVVISLIGIIGIIYVCVWWNKYKHSKESAAAPPSIANNRNTLRPDPNKIHHLQNAHAVQVNLKELIVAYDTQGSNR